MPDTTLHEFLAAATQKAADELAAAFLRLPEDRRDGTAEGKSRSALDMVAECALLNGYAVTLLETHAWPSGVSYEAYLKEKEAAKAQGWDSLSATLQENTRRVIAALREVPEDAFPLEVRMISRVQTMSEIMAYPYWNMTYHMGQINYIASMLGCLD